MLANVPVAHGVGSVDPAKHDEPTGHRVHSPSCSRSVRFEKVPDGHGRGVVLPSGQKWPLQQSSGTSVASV